MDKKQNYMQEVDRIKKMNEFVPEDAFRDILKEYNKKFGKFIRRLHP